MDMSKMLKDLQKMQSKMLKAQNDLKAQSFDGEGRHERKRRTHDGEDQSGCS